MVKRKTTIDQHLFYAPDIESIPVLPEDESNHCVRVLRLKKGCEITIADGKGSFYTATIDYANTHACSVTITGQEHRPPHWKGLIHIAVAPTKSIDRMEWFAEKATEIGIDEITFLRCRHSERDDINLQRIHKIIFNAMKQSQQATIPRINDMVDFKVFAELSTFDASCKMIAHCNDKLERTLIKNIYNPHSDALIIIGPEGDFCNDEIDLAMSNGFTAVSLGESRLRTETAALFVCQTIHIINQ